MSDPARPLEHWTATVQPLLDALAPRGVWTPGDDELSARTQGYAEELGLDVCADPGERTDAVVLSGEPNYHFVDSCLESAVGSGVGGEHGPPVIVIGASGWPHGDRDGYRDPERIPASRRRAYARCLPDPDEVWLSPEPAALAYALESGGETNGVRPALETVLAAGGWQARLLEGFGGLAVLVPEARLAASPGLARAFDRLSQDGGAQALLRRLDAELARAALSTARLVRALAEQEATEGDLRSRLIEALDELDHGLDADDEAVRDLSEGLTHAGSALAAAVRREHSLKQRAKEAEALTTAARNELFQERSWVIQQARVLAGSQAWRVGHRLARTARVLTFRRAGVTDAVQRIVVRMERGLSSDEP